MMNCEQIQGLLDEYRMKRLAPEEAAAVAEHLAGCASCSEELAMLQKLNDTLSSSGLDEPETEYFAAMRKKLNQRIAADDGVSNHDQQSTPQAKVMDVKARHPKRYRWMEIAAAFLIGASAMLLLQSIEEQQVGSDETHLSLSRKKEMALADDATRLNFPTAKARTDSENSDRIQQSASSEALPAAASLPANEEGSSLLKSQIEEQKTKDSGPLWSLSEDPKAARAASAPSAAPAPPAPTENSMMAMASPETMPRNLSIPVKDEASAEKGYSRTTTETRINPMAILQEIKRNAENDKSAPTPTIDIAGAMAAAQASAPTPAPVHVWRSKTIDSSTTSTPTQTNALSNYLAAEDIASAGSTSEAIIKFNEIASTNPNSHVALRATLRVAELQEAAGDTTAALETYRKCLQPPLLVHASPTLRDEIERRIARLAVR